MQLPEQVFFVTENYADLKIEPTLQSCNIAMPGGDIETSLCTCMQHRVTKRFS